MLDTLQQVRKDGFSDAAVAAALNTTEFALRENNTGRFPRGLSMMLRAMGAWIYDRDPYTCAPPPLPRRALRRRRCACAWFFGGLVFGTAALWIGWRTAQARRLFPRKPPRAVAGALGLSSMPCWLWRNRVIFTPRCWHVGCSVLRCALTNSCSGHPRLHSAANITAVVRLCASAAAWRLHRMVRRCKPWAATAALTPIPCSRACQHAITCALCAETQAVWMQKATGCTVGHSCRGVQSWTRPASGKHGNHPLLHGMHDFDGIIVFAHNTMMPRRSCIPWIDLSAMLPWQCPCLYPTFAPHDRSSICKKRAAGRQLCVWH